MSDIPNLEAILAAPLPSGSPGPVPDSLQHLFNKDPLGLTAQDISQIVEVLRAQRLAFLTEESTSKGEGRKPNYKKENKKAAEGFDPSKLSF